MAVKFKTINKAHKEFIEKQKMFVIGSAGAEGFINVSPKGMDTFKIIDEHTVVWLNHTGSGNETSAHVQENGRMTIMFNSFDKAPMILKLYGTADVIHDADERWDEMCTHFNEFLGARQFFELKVELVLTSCGFGVPQYKYIGERNKLEKWAKRVGREGMKVYWTEKNVETLDGEKTNVLERSK
ncbi:MAG: Pyridoxamine 5'-phosphate oxidase [uncultured Sulfurovum sp.]|uniref:Pyridoxamine 5'-phosphate oxidase n=1 Tax=uncultured Sulfurovum sp. TaxID=269237 RepID=A0A6S6TGF3_9BACT|nr:MAG: Pyridoxamine 5'-phosphate oxidase [uncultured Sulfurovum sp.]